MTPSNPTTPKKKRVSLKKFNEMLRVGAEGLRQVKRGMQGLPLEDPDVFSGLINVKDIKERTRLTETNIFAHTYFRAVYQMYPVIFDIFFTLAELEDTYFISEDGKQREEAIFLRRANQPAMIPGQPLELPTLVRREPKQQKTGLLRRG